MIQVDVLSDPICPWCYIGKRKIDQALNLVETGNYILNWHPFQLNPDMPKPGMDRHLYLESKFGGAESARRAYGAVKAAATECGLRMQLDRIFRTPNTLDAHRLIYWAGANGRQGELVDRLFHAYFVAGLDIGNPQVLTEIAGESGLDANDIAQRLKTEEDKDRIRILDSTFRAAGVRGVPCFLVDGRVIASGAQPAEFWLTVLPRLAREPNSPAVRTPSGIRKRGSASQPAGTG
ncbi:MAG: DsbA family oxidoreductase [Paracoccaceae bacterium]|nr:DsbA family oxidoreductase [Paracoccaceae bacterium]